MRPESLKHGLIHMHFITSDRQLEKHSIKEGTSHTTRPTTEPVFSICKLLEKVLKKVNINLNLRVWTPNLNFGKLNYIFIK